mmetsp:Transcript_72802/g.205905  ORF Transcript_72802/g.205905 Transcript_72802/m.205905 type:complete len:235 (+) Transcript_72802:349-1053(+)
MAARRSFARLTSSSMIFDAFSTASKVPCRLTVLSLSSSRSSRDTSILAPESRVMALIVSPPLPMRTPTNSLATCTTWRSAACRSGLCCRCGEGSAAWWRSLQGDRVSVARDRGCDHERDLVRGDVRDRERFRGLPGRDRERAAPAPPPSDSGGGGGERERLDSRRSLEGWAQGDRDRLLPAPTRDRPPGGRLPLPRAGGVADLLPGRSQSGGITGDGTRVAAAQHASTASAPGG